MQEIILEQGGNPNIDSEDLKPGRYPFELKASKSGIVKKLNSKDITIIARLLGAPTQKGAGIFLDKKIGKNVEKGDTVLTLYSEKEDNLKEAKDTLQRFPIATIL